MVHGTISKRKMVDGFYEGQDFWSEGSDSHGLLKVKVCLSGFPWWFKVCVDQETASDNIQSDQMLRYAAKILC